MFVDAKLLGVVLEAICGSYPDDNDHTWIKQRRAERYGE